MASTTASSDCRRGALWSRCSWQRFWPDVTIGMISSLVWFPVLLVASLAVVLVLSTIAPWFFRCHGDRVIEPEIKLVFCLPFALMVLADEAHSQAAPSRATSCPPTRRRSSYTNALDTD
jgi:hypothetical protein